LSSSIKNENELDVNNMKKIYSIFFYFYFFFSVHALSCLEDSEIIALPEFEDIQITLGTIRNIQYEFEFEDSVHEIKSDVMMEVILICVEMYEKIIEATVTYYLLINVPGKQNIHDVIIKIIVNHVLKIINILYREFMHYLFNHELTWKEKMIHCAWILGFVFVIKMGLEKLPKTTKPMSLIVDIHGGNTEKTFWPTAKKGIC